MTRQELIAQKAEEFAGVNYGYDTEADSLYRYVQKEAFSAGAEWADQTMLDKVCQYLFENYHGEKLSFRMIEDLRKAMEEQQ